MVSPVLAKRCPEMEPGRPRRAAGGEGSEAQVPANP